jgi:hypothetical protein
MDLTGLGSLFDFGSKLIERIWPDPAQRAQASLELAKLQQSGELQKLALETDLLKGQLQINQEEAKSTNWFVAGWRPAVGWTCAAGLLYATIIDPMARFIAMTVFHYTGAFPDIATGILVATLTGMLGIGTMRTVEKVKGAEGNR